MSPFDLEISRQQPSLFMEPPVVEYQTPRETQATWIKRLRTLVNIATKQLQERQRRYKVNSDQRIQHVS